MNRVVITLNQLENRLQSLIEDGTARFFPDFASSRHLVAMLEEAMRTGTRQGKDGERYAPNLFSLLFSPEHASMIQKDSAWIEQLEKTLAEIGEYLEYIFPSPPVVRIVTANDLELGEVRVLAECNLELYSDTDGTVVDRAIEPQEIEQPGFLIVNGTHVFALDQPVVNIGRRSDNQLVVDDIRVSRLHAQIRWINHNYVIFDLDSSGGTWVNGERIRQYKLIPGDVIVLAGVPLVFGLEKNELGNTRDSKPLVPGEQENQ